jgi:hypothetical protein
VRIDFPEGALEKLDALKPETFSDPALSAAFLDAIDRLKTTRTPQECGNRLIARLAAKPDAATAHRSARFLWQHVNRHTRSFEPVKALAESMLETQPSAASAMARVGLDALERHRGHTFYKRETDIPFLKSIRGRAALKMGLVVIPVPNDHPVYPVYQSQAEWTTGNEDSAWKQLDANWDAFTPIHRELSVSYLFWVLQQTMNTRDEERQEALIKLLLGWSNESGSPLSPAEKAGIDIAYGDIAVQPGQLREAREIYARAEKNQAYAGLPVRHRATLQRAAAERLAKDFDGALNTLNTLNELALERVADLWSDIRFERS